MPPPSAKRRTRLQRPDFTPDTDVHLLDRLAVLYRYRRIAFAVFVLTTAAMMIQGYTTIQVLPCAGPAADRERALDGGSRPRRAQRGVLRRSRAVLQDAVQDSEGPRPHARVVVAKLDLEQVPEFNGTPTPPATPLSLVERSPDSVSVARLLAPGRRRQPEAPKVDETPDESALVGAFIGRVSVDPVRGSRLVDVSFDSRDPAVRGAGRQRADGRVRRPEPRR